MQIIHNVQEFPSTDSKISINFERVNIANIK